MIRSKPLTLQDGAILFQEGELGDYAYFIEDGQIDLISSFGNREILLGTLESGDLLGEMAMIDQQPRSATAKIRGTTKVLQIHASQISDRLARDPLISFFLKAILQRFRDMRYRLNLVANHDILEEIDNTPQHKESYAAESMLVGQTIRDEIRLGTAFDNHELELFAQPVVSIPERKFLGAEGLLRWRHPTQGILGPGRFITQAENSGLIVNIGYMIIEKACEILNTFDRLFNAKRMLNPISFMSINVSPRQLQEPDFTDRVQDIVQDSGINSQRLKLEITENMMLEQPKLTKTRLTALKDIGVRIAMDDFGIGFSSLSTLMDYPFDTLKIDRSFVTRLDIERKAFNVIETIITLANKLDFDVIVEGVEQESQFKLLTELGCTAMQGYIFSKPLPLHDLAILAGLPNGLASNNIMI